MSSGDSSNAMKLDMWYLVDEFMFFYYGKPLLSSQKYSQSLSSQFEYSDLIRPAEPVISAFILSAPVHLLNNR